MLRGASAVMGADHDSSVTFKALCGLVGELQHVNPGGDRERHVLQWVRDQTRASAAAFVRAPGLRPTDFDPALVHTFTVGMTAKQYEAVARARGEARCPHLAALQRRARYLGPGDLVVASREELVSDQHWLSSDSGRLHRQVELDPALTALRWMPQASAFHVLTLYRSVQASELSPTVKPLVEMLWSAMAWLLGPDAPAGASATSGGAARQPFARPPVELSPRLTEVFDRLMAGKSAAEIADELCLSVHTVYEHMQRLYRRLNVRSRVELLHTYGHGA